VLTHKGITPIDLNEEIVYGPEIGKGAFGVVLRCKFRDTDCAIKQLRLPTVGTPRAEQHKGARASVAVLEGLLSEFDTMMTLRHPNVRRHGSHSVPVTRRHLGVVGCTAARRSATLVCLCILPHRYS
jgi:serine/threonine protein kinase